jgi:integrase
MPRPAKPWYRKSRSMWTITLDGVQTPLGVTDPSDELAAVVAWKNLTSSVTTAAPGAGRTLREVVAAYLASPDLDVADSTRGRLRWSLGKFVAVLGDVPAASLTARQIETALPTHLSASSRHGAIGDLLGCLTWAGVTVAGKVRRPPKESRGADCVLTPGQFEVVKALASGDLRPFVVVLWETGCRPGEVAAATAENTDWKNSQVRLRGHKTRRYTGRDRVVVLTPVALDVLRAQRDRYGSGHLFRTTRGKPFGIQRVNQRFQAIAERAGFPAFAYMFRHTFITRALEAGYSDAQVAALVGHTSPAMIHRNYNHIAQNARLLKSLADNLSASMRPDSRSA